MQIVGQKAEAARPSVGAQRAAGIAKGLAESPRAVTLSREQGVKRKKKKINTNPLSSVAGGLSGLSAPRMSALVGIWCFAQNGLDGAPS